MTTVVGVDPSLASTGLVVWRDGRFYVSTVATSPTDPPAHRHHVTAMRMLGVADPDRRPGSTLYVMEARINPGDGTGKGTTALDLAEQRGVLNHAIHTTGQPKVDVHPGTLKVYATGRGNASKHDMYLAARGRLGHHLYASNADEADAAWLVAITMDHYGRPLCRMPTKHRAAVRRPAWPPFTLEEA